MVAQLFGTWEWEDPGGEELVSRWSLLLEWIWVWAPSLRYPNKGLGARSE